MERTFAIIKPDATSKRYTGRILQRVEEAGFTIRAIVAMVLEAPDAIKKWRTLMGATDPSKADLGTIRKEFASSIGENATHGSDAPETAAFEISYFFAGMELID